LFDISETWFVFRRTRYALSYFSILEQRALSFWVQIISQYYVFIHYLTRSQIYFENSAIPFFKYGIFVSTTNRESAFKRKDYRLAGCIFYGQLHSVADQSFEKGSALALNRALTLRYEIIGLSPHCRSRNHSRNRPRSQSRPISLDDEAVEESRLFVVNTTRRDATRRDATATATCPLRLLRDYYIIFVYSPLYILFRRIGSPGERYNSEGDFKVAQNWWYNWLDEATRSDHIVFA